MITAYLVRQKKGINNMSDNWTEAGSASDETWKPENAGDSVTGKYVKVRDNVGANSSNMYYLEQESADGKDKLTISVWGSTVLDTKFEEIPVGSQVKIEFLGLEKGKGAKPYKNFKVLYKAPDNWADDAKKAVDEEEADS